MKISIVKERNVLIFATLMMKVNILSPLKPVVSGVYEAVDHGFRFFEECDRSRTAVDSRRKSIASKHFELWDSLI